MKKLYSSFKHSFSHLSIAALAFVLLFGANSCTKDGAGAENGFSSVGAGGSLARFSIVGNYLYMVNRTELKAYLISNPSVPLLKSTIPLDWDIETIYPYNNKLYIGSQSGMYVFSIQNPEKPKLEGSVRHVRACDPVIGNDSVAYVTLRSFGTNCGSLTNVLNVYSLKQANPILVKSITMVNPIGLGMRDSALYVCDGNLGLTVFNIKNAFNPIPIDTIKDLTAQYRDVIPYNNTLISYVSNGIQLFDISQPQQPIRLGKILY
jgi:hypothetical protein